jgi:hypothetical protein
MQINNLDLLHHKILVGKSQGGDVSAYETELNSHVTQGFKDKCPLTLDFINRLNANKPLVLKPSFIQRHADKIIRYTEKPYQLTKWFLIASTITAFIVEAFYA